MRDMPVVVVGVVHVVELLELIMLPDVHRREAAAQLFQGVGESGIPFQNGRSLDGRTEYIEHNLIVHGGTCIQSGPVVGCRRIFRRVAGVDDQPLILGVLYQEVGIK